MKKLGAFLLASALLAACGSGESESTTTEAGDVLKGRSSMPPVNPAGANLLPTGVIAAPAKPPIPTATITANPAPAVKPNDTFLFLAFGDSYGSGEGNPLVPGDYTKNIKEQWAGAIANGAIAETGDERCHRSDASGSAKAAVKVKTQFPQLNVVHKSFACSGAVSANILDTPYKGTDEAVFKGKTDLPAQIEQAKAAVVESDVDAIYVSIGGNDAFFGDVVAECFVYQRFNTSLCKDSSRSKVQAALGALGSIPGRIAEVASELRTAFPNAAIIFSAYPDPLSVDPNDIGDINGDGICSKEDKTADANWESDEDFWRLETDDAFFIRDQFLIPLNQKIHDGVDDASQDNPAIYFVDSHFTGNKTGGFCAKSGTPIVRFNKEALVIQGNDPDTSTFISKGGWHPSDAGYAAYANAIFDGIISSGALQSPDAPADPSAPWATSITSSGKFSIAWSDLSNNESRFEITYTSGSKVNSATVTPGQTSFTFDGGTAPAVYTVAVRACRENAVGTTKCSNWKSTTMSNALPSDKPGAVSCTSSKYGQFVDSACNVTFSVPAKPAQTASMFSYVEIKKGSTVVGAAVMPPGSGQVKLKYQGEKEGSTAQFTATAYICTIVDGGKCVAGPSSKISLVIEKPDSRKLLPAPVIPVRPNVNLPKLPGVPAPVMTPPGLGGGLQCSAGKCGP